jgi:hypothetical protein
MRPFVVKTGTKSILFGSHQFIIHPVFVALSWWFLYGFPWDIRLWIAFIIHDWGYWGKETMDGPDGETHPEWAARIMTRFFGKTWGDFCAGHSRSYARKIGLQQSALSAADKFSMYLTPAILYIPLAYATGELQEYMENCLDQNKYASQVTYTRDKWNWWQQVQENGYRIGRGLR